MPQSNLNLFFKDPKTPKRIPNDFSVLYLLRRDVYQCMGIDPNTGCKTGNQAIWPGVMAILAGIDLLGKFYAGSDDIGQAGPRFRDYIKKYFNGIGPQDHETIYQLRNALLHSFGLYSKYRNNVYRFILDQNLSSFITHTPPDKYIIDVRKLHCKFEESIDLYYTDLKNNQNLQNNLNAIFPNYGKIHIG
ncbi:hypothetical protein HF289_09340 [Acidithiobacillus ferrooxidans]|jgi:hypothetical protein|uniref:hypothetical protein n=2 Tax=Acidithiobacillus TaxID=119977 RepID=UPI001C078BC7|nr:hypothetical protein [Acidithiobacillus ferrooxidans]MBU2857062.1 hypothetical protein [Acidithiobacillus ferrooxidans]MBU2859448.1 hypothetical protein [Acidithiobacillus ferrooxidans]